MPLYLHGMFDLAKLEGKCSSETRLCAMLIKHSSMKGLLGIFMQADL